MLVKIKPEYRNPSEADLTYIVVENNGDRLIIQESREKSHDMEIIPTELVRSYQVEVVPLKENYSTQ